MKEKDCRESCSGLLKSVALVWAEAHSHLSSHISCPPLSVRKTKIKYFLKPPKQQQKPQNKKHKQNKTKQIIIKMEWFKCMWKAAYTLCQLPPPPLNSPCKSASDVWTFISLDMQDISETVWCICNKKGTAASLEPVKFTVLKMMAFWSRASL